MDRNTPGAPEAQQFGDVVGATSRTVAPATAKPSNPFRRWWSLGYRNLVPIVPPEAPLYEKSAMQRSLTGGTDTRGRAPGIQGSDGRWFGMSDWVGHITCEEDLERWFAMGAGVGIRTGDLGDGTALVLIDADTVDLERAQLIKKEIEKRFGKLPVRIGRYPKAGYLIRVSGPFPYSKIEFGDAPRERVELLSNKKQFVAEGVHPVTMEPYRWPADAPALNDLPMVEAHELMELLEALRAILPAATAVSTEGGGAEVDQASLKGDLDLVRRAVEATPNTTDRFPNREAFRNFGYMIKGATQDDPALGLALFEDWADRWIDPPSGKENKPGYAASEWSRMKPPSRVGASLLFETAQSASGGQFSTAEMWIDPPDGTSSADMSRETAKAPTKRLNFIPLDEAGAHALTASAKPLIKGLLDQGAMTILYGESNSGKTFVALDIAHHVAGGRPWAGLRTTKMGVAAVAAEGGGGARKRAAALRTKYGLADGFHVLLQSVNLLRPDADLAPLIAAVKAIEPPVGLVIIDTLSRAMAGGDENSSTDMGAMVKHLDALRLATGAHVLVVHHSGKDKARGARGHSLLRAATDTEIEIADREVRVTKQRDLDMSFRSAFVLDVVTLGMDDDGDAVTSCTVRLVSDTEAAAIEPVAPTAGERRILDVLSTLSDVAIDPEKGISPAEIAAHFAKGPDIMSAGNVRAGLSELVIKRHVVRVERGRYRKIGHSVPARTQENASCVRGKGHSVFD